MGSYNTKLGDKICEHTATSSIGLRHICKQLNIPYSTATSWIYDKEHELYSKYIRAKRLQLYHIEEEIIEISDDSTNDYMTIVKNGKKVVVLNREAIARSRLRIQTRITILTKLAPKIHGTNYGMPDRDDVNIVIKGTPLPRQAPSEGTTEATTSPAPVTPPSPSEKAGEMSSSTPSSSSPKNASKPAPAKLSENARLRAIYEEQLRYCADSGAPSQNTGTHNLMHGFMARANKR